MIKRRFYKVEHGDNEGDAASDSSSSFSEADPEPQFSEDESSDADSQLKDASSSSSSSGYESEDSSVNEVGIDSSGLLTSEDDAETDIDRKGVTGRGLSVKKPKKVPEPKPGIVDERDPISSDALEYVLKSKSVFKCRLCPRIVCLSEESLKAHLKSKRHIRSEKLLKEGRLKAMLNSDGEIEYQETAMEMHARCMAEGKDKANKKNRGRQRQRKRLRNKKMGDSVKVKANQEAKGPAGKRHKK